MTATTPSNRLGDALSPYLLQHADNPVHWQPWDREALAMARTLNEPPGGAPAIDAPPSIMQFSGKPIRTPRGHRGS